MARYDMPPDKATGCLPRETRLGEEFLVYEDRCPVIPRPEWEDAINDALNLRLFVQGIFDQDGEGSCCANMGAQGMEIVGVAQLGARLHVRYSPMSLYKRIGRGPNSGASIDSCIRELASRGILPMDTPENKQRFRHTHPAIGWRHPLPDGWEETASMFRAMEWYDVASWEGFISALLYGYPVCYGSDGHAKCAVYPHDGGKAIIYANSWGAGWGDDGFGVESERNISRQISGYGAWALRAVTIDPRFFELPEVR